MTTGGRTFTRVLRDLPEGQAVTLGDLLAAAGSRAHGAALLLLSLPEALPLPLPSASAILGVPLVVVSAHLMLFGEAGALPRRLRERALPPWLLDLLRRRVVPLLGRAERLSHPRWLRLAGRERPLGLVCLYLSVLLLLPLPFFNVPPALCLVLLAWGMVQRDGVAVAAGLAGTVVLTAVLLGLVEWVRLRLE
jgi:hypothetical protein